MNPTDICEREKERKKEADRKLYLDNVWACTVTKIRLKNVTKYSLYGKKEKNFTSRIKKKIVTIDLNSI